MHQALNYGAELLAFSFDDVIEVNVASSGTAKNRREALVQRLQSGFKVRLAVSEWAAAHRCPLWCC